MNNLEEFLSIAYDTTQRGLGYSKITMTTNWASNQSLFYQEFKLIVMPTNNKIPKPKKGGGTIVSSPIGYKELIVWVYFGDNTHWSGPQLKWLYMDRSIQWDGYSKKGDVMNIEELTKISSDLMKEATRIRDIEFEYYNKHGSFDGLVIEGYAIVE